MPKVYLDMCAIQRPLDTPHHVRVALEAEAVLGILSLCDAGLVELVASEVLAYENAQNPVSLRRIYGAAVLARATTTVRVTDSVIIRATQLVHHGIKPLDALHIAAAEAG